MTQPVLHPQEDAVVAAPAPRKRGPLGRLGCAIGLVFWFLLILSPCLLFTLATQGEISLSLGSAPEQVARLWLVMEDDGRGLALSLPSVQSSADGNLVCVQTDVRYYLWQGQEDPSQYCACYTRPAADVEWQFTHSNDGACTAESLEAAAQP
jgi:hypothetical protein